MPGGSEAVVPINGVKLPGHVKLISLSVQTCNTSLAGLLRDAFASQYDLVSPGARGLIRGGLGALPAAAADIRGKHPQSAKDPAHLWRAWLGGAQGQKRPRACLGISRQVRRLGIGRRALRQA